MWRDGVIEGMGEYGGYLLWWDVEDIVCSMEGRVWKRCMWRSRVVGYKLQGRWI